MSALALFSRVGGFRVFGGKNWQDSKLTIRVVVASGLALGCSALLVLTLIGWTVQRADNIAANTKRHVLIHSLQANTDKVPYDQESVAIWDDAIKNVRFKFDYAWVENNIGVWMAEYFKHDRIDLLDDQNRIIYSHLATDPTAAPAQLPKLDASGADGDIRRLVAQLRSNIEKGALDAFEAGKTRIPRVVDKILLEGRPAVVSLMPIVSDTGQIPQERGSEYLLLTYRFLDASFVADLVVQHQLLGAHFSLTGRHSVDEESLALRNDIGLTIGYFVWQLPRPGRELLLGMLPILAFGSLSVGVTVAALIHSLRKIYAQLITSETQARIAARHDRLTGLPNRAFFDDHLSDALASSKTGPALLFLDLDRFKQVNDTLGHPAGDALIVQLSRRLSRLTAARGFLARMGGDEFALVLPDGSSRPQTVKLCEEILSVATAPYWLTGSQAVVGISIGVAFAESGDTASDLARKADIALYHAKNTGRQRFACYTDELGSILSERRLLEIELRSAIKSGAGLSVAYQPIHSAKTLELAGIEALTRWHNPRLGPISPQVFIDVAEEGGLMEPLGALILREACAMAARTRVPSIAVNASASQLVNSGFYDLVLQTLEETGLAPSCLEIEITERTLVDAESNASVTLRKLRQIGVRIALDDFGTGYSSLSYLMDHTVDRLKIDRSFVSQVGEGSEANALVMAIVAMAHALKIVVTAEGVETPEQRTLLQLLGCDNLQGYLMSKPLQAPDLQTYLKRLSSEVA